LRFLLGVAEAGFFPGMIYYFTLWFPKAYRARFAAAFICAIPLSGMIGGPLSGFILGMDGVGGLQGWQWLFLLEGLPASILGFAALKWLPDGPAGAPWLSLTEKQTIAASLAAEDTAEHADLWRALCDPRVLVLALPGFGNGCSLYGTLLWLPQIVNGMGFSTLATGFVTALVYTITMGAILLLGYSSDRRGERFRHLALTWVLAATGYAVAALAGSDLVALAGLTLAIAGTQASISPYFCVPSAFLRGPAAAGAIALINVSASLGGFVAPYLIGILKERSGDYSSAMALLGLGLTLAAIIILALGRAMAPRKLPLPQRGEGMGVGGGAE
jgi:ACS family tartrate transporter-like MFS transporter